MEPLLNNPLLLMALSIAIGQAIGSRQIRYFKLGSSATLFVGLLMSYFITAGFHTEVAVPKIIFSLSLIGFIVSVGLAASKSISTVLKMYGVKFLILGAVVTLSGMISTFLLADFFREMKYSIIGTYVGALTSSPGLATALEIAKTLPGDQSAAIGLGYSIAYIPGILIVIVFAQLMGKRSEAQSSPVQLVKPEGRKERGFSLAGLMLVVAVGILLGSIEISTGRTGRFSLDMTGGVLISALFFGSFKRVSIFDFNDRYLGILRDISLNMFLAIVGLNYGYATVSAIQIHGVQLLLIGLVTGLSSIAGGYIVGKYILKLDTVQLVGGICGGMTSTPGLAAAIDAFKGEAVVAGYGATYPFALLLMIVFTKLLFMG